MALKKDIEINGLINSYHRIERLTSCLNKHISIVIFSYPNAEVREKERTKENVIHFSTTYELDYVENYTIKEAYDFIKSLEDFKDAEDI
jgi:hypothetical protein